MYAVTNTIRRLFDPRGRCNRRGLLFVATFLIGVEIALLAMVGAGWAKPGTATLAVKAIVLWIALAATCRRLHDCGLSAWWAARGMLAILLWCLGVTVAIVALGGPGALAPHSPWLPASVAAVMLPTLALTVWLHCAPGQRGTNDYGPEPGPDGFSDPPHRSIPATA